MVLLLYELFFWLPSLSVVGVSLVVLRTTTLVRAWGY